jgi:transglutaminase-like putative cysteine protease
MRNYITAIIAATLLCINLQAQTKAPKVKFGKVSEDELSMKQYEKDTSADAVVLFDKGELRFIYENNKGFQYIFDKHIRIKIFNANALNYANHTISLYHNPRAAEKITSLRAYSFNLVNEKVEKSKLGMKDIMWTELNDNIDNGSFAIPNVIEGSIIDIKYTIKSDYIYNLRSWTFQYDIPVEWSEYTVTIPEFYKYRPYFYGYYKLNTNKKIPVTEKYTYEIKGKPGKGGKVEVYEGELNSNSSRLYFASSHIPAIEKEPFMPTIKNYKFQVEFELTSIQFPNQAPKHYSKSWESIDNELLTHNSFGFQLQKLFVADEVNEITINSKNDEEKLYAIYNYVKNNIRWNGDYSILTTKSLNKVFSEKTGSSGDINLLLTLMLKEAGLNTSPVIISTKNNGMVDENQPGLNQFNYTICNVKIDNKNYFLDGTDPYCAPNFLPTRCTSGKGRVIKESGSGWIDLSPNFISKNTVGGSFEIDLEGNLNGKLQKYSNNYYAYNLLNKIDDYDDLDNYIEEYQNKNHNLDISVYKFDSLRTIKKINSKYNVSIQNQVETINDLVLINPLNIYTENDNPFKNDKRTFPIYFNFPSEETYVMNYKIPEGYKVEELPESINLANPENTLRFIYKIVLNGDYINVTCKKTINKTLFLPAEYDTIKNFYNQMISKQDEKIILKKIS